ncbi:MAG TPA: YceD family protein [Verrucomicrobiae bacterium]
MMLLVNCRHLETRPVHLQGEIPAGEMDLDPRDEVIQAEKPLRYDLEVEQFEDGLLVTGDLRLDLRCQCVRCLKAFTHRLHLENWTRHLPLEGEEKVAVVNDCVDLTPFVREDMLLEFPQHPLCEPECQGLPKMLVGRPKNTSDAGPPETGSPAWNELNKLRF